jgi:hypothetical protein
VSANVSGLSGRCGHAERQLLKRCSPEEIESVMGHEMWHYVLHHLEKGIVFSGILIVAGFAFLMRRSRPGAPSRDAMGIRGATCRDGFRDLASAYLVVMTLVIHSIIRVQEAEADVFGLNASARRLAREGRALTGGSCDPPRRHDPVPDLRGRRPQRRRRRQDPQTVPPETRGEEVTAAEPAAPPLSS